MQSTPVSQATILWAADAARRANVAVIVVEEDYKGGCRISLFAESYADTDMFKAFNSRILATVCPDGEVRY